MLDVGALPQQIDKALENFGFAMGPFRVGDLAGNDIGWAIRKRLYVEYPDRPFFEDSGPHLRARAASARRPAPAGTTTSRAIATPFRRRSVTQIVLEESARLGLTRRKVSDEEIVERALYSLINEGARILEEGIALRSSDIDVVYIAGYGFPDFRGGPMFYADTVGLPNILRAMRGFAQGLSAGCLGARAARCSRLASENRGFASWGNQS